MPDRASLAAEPDVLAVGSWPRPSVAAARLLLALALLAGAAAWLLRPTPPAPHPAGAHGVWLGVQQVRAAADDGVLKVDAVLGNHSVDDVYVQLRPADQPGPRAIRAHFGPEGWIEWTTELVPAPLAYIGPSRSVRVVVEYDLADPESISRTPASLVLRLNTGEVVRVPFGTTWRQLTAEG